MRLHRKLLQSQELNLMKMSTTPSLQPLPSRKLLSRKKM
jgi:hypothetical protein